MKTNLFGKARFTRTAGVFLTWAVLLAASCSLYRPGNKTLINYVQAQNQYSHGNFAGAITMLPRVTLFAPALTLRGKALYFSGESEKAEKTLRFALFVRPSSTESAIYLARILREKGATKNALAIVENIISDDPSCVRALRLAAELSNGSERKSAFLDRAIEAGMENALVFLDRARQRWIEGDGQGALEDIRGAKALVTRGAPLYFAADNLEHTILMVLK
jgi:tetratricopeptide (TPR) repeat protein